MFDILITKIHLSFDSHFTIIFNRVISIIKYTQDSNTEDTKDKCMRLLYKL